MKNYRDIENTRYIISRVFAENKTTAMLIEHITIENFGALGIWTPAHKNAPFICLEPWHGCAAVDNETGEFVDKPYCITLRPGEKKTLEYKVSRIWKNLV